MTAPPHVLVIGAHPDDAELAVGGTIARLSDAGARVTVAHFTTSEYTPEGAAGRRLAAEKAAAVLGHALVWVDGGVHRQVEDLKEYEVVGRIDRLVAEHAPDVVITHWDGDSHGDHVRLARAAVASSRCWAADLYAFGPNDLRTTAAARFAPNTFVDITAVEPRKEAALAAYSYPGQGFRPLPLELYRSASACHGHAVRYGRAEALLAIRQRGFGIGYLSQDPQGREC